MCGIIACFQQGVVVPEQAIDLHHRRGPDMYQQLRIRPWLTVHSFVLHMQSIALQPIVWEGNVLCFNGEIYFKEYDESDSVWLMKRLSELKSPQERVEMLDELEGEWSLVFFSATDETVLYGRDRFGRRGLLEGRRNFDDNNIAYLSSLAWDSLNISWTEIRVSNMFCMNQTGTVIVPIDRVVTLNKHAVISSSTTPTWMRLLYAL